jgi:hypothetical protein
MYIVSKECAFPVPNSIVYAQPPMHYIIIKLSLSL